MAIEGCKKMPVEEAGEKNAKRSKRHWPRRKNKKFSIFGLAAFINTYRDEQRANRKQEEGEDKAKRSMEKWTLGFVILTTIGVFVQAGILHQSDAAFQITAKEAIEARKLSEANTRRQLRPYILFDNGYVTFNGDLAFPTAIFKNTGSTPAYSVQRWFDASIDDYNINIERHAIHERFKQKTLGPESTDLGNGTPYLITKPVDFSSLNRSRITMRAKAIYIWGSIKYFDDSAVPRCFYESFFARAELPANFDNPWPLNVIFNETFSCDGVGSDGLPKG
jgi:hypothetical protein